MVKATSKAKRKTSTLSSTGSTKSIAGKTSNKRLVLRIKSGTDKDEKLNLKSKPRRRSQKKKGVGNVDPRMPKKPPTAFFYFLEDFRKEFQLQNPTVKSMREVGKACGKKWKTMSYEEKVQYYDIATEKRAEFDTAMAAYLKRKANGEEGESESDLDLSE